MSAFRDAAHAADFIGGFFRQESVAGGRFFAGSGMINAYTLTDPDVRIVIDGKVLPEPGRAFDVYVNDPNAPDPDAEFFMSAETFDKVFRGEAQPLGLLMSGKVKSKGDVTAAMKLLPALGAVIPHYKTYAEQHLDA